jgi:heat shock protein HslJ
MDTMNKLVILAFGSVAALLLTACAPSASSQDLTGSFWLLSELKGASLIDGTTITAQFDASGRISGTSGCNNYSTTYDINGSQLTISEPVASTMMACPEPIMEQEQEYMSVLAEMASFEINNEELIIKDSTGDELARFEAVDQSLEGSSWQVLSYNNGKGGVTSLIIGTEITANFESDNQLTGNSGCNSYFGQYEIDADNININGVGATEMACLEPEGLMEQEQQYLAALEIADTYKIEGLTLEMRTADGALVASFQRDSAQ